MNMNVQQVALTSAGTSSPLRLTVKGLPAMKYVVGAIVAPGASLVYRIEHTMDSDQSGDIVSPGAGDWVAMDEFAENSGSKLVPMEAAITAVRLVYVSGAGTVTLKLRQELI
jgi:hypothetical protein